MVSRLTLFLIAVVYCGLPVFGQQHHNHAACGTTVTDQDLIKDRLFKNRRNKDVLLSQFEDFKTSRSNNNATFWIPVVFHMISKADGTGQHGDAWVLQQMCFFNENFADQNMKFYLKGINRFNSDIIYVNENGEAADYIRSVHKDLGAMNIYVGGPTRAGSGYGAYYSPIYDWIFTWKDIYDWGLTHEVGHYLTLAHTFNGWESVEYDDASAATGHAPEMGTNGRPVETVNRGTAGENCQYAADGFCDTPPDYSSSGGAGCSSIITWNDPNNVSFNLDESVRLNYMSYFFCGPKEFSPNQKEAIRLDNISRGYHFNTPPEPVEIADGNVPNVIFPVDGSLAPYTSTAVEFKWDAMSSANMYHVIVERTYNGIVVSRVADRVVFSNYLWLQLDPNTEYTWTVEALTRHDLCNKATNKTAPQKFSTADWASSAENISLPIESSRVFPNPTAGSSEIILEINVALATEAQISIVNSLGQKAITAQTISLNTGNNAEQIDISALSAGVYIVNIETATERISHKLMIQK